MPGDTAFLYIQFTEFPKTFLIGFRPVSKRRHTKIVLESKHGENRGLFFRIINEDDSNEINNSLQSVALSIGLFDSDVLSTFELAKKYSKSPTNCLKPYSIINVRIDSPLALHSKAKVSLSLRSKSVSYVHISMSDLSSKSSSRP